MFSEIRLLIIFAPACFCVIMVSAGCVGKPVNSHVTNMNQLGGGMSIAWAKEELIKSRSRSVLVSLSLRERPIGL